jgi:uncharacterized repeat protein (TIGR03803 family)
MHFKAFSLFQSSRSAMVHLFLASAALAAFSSYAAAETNAAAAKVKVTETELYAFQGGSDGAEPLAGPIMDSAGNLYGTTVGFDVPSDFGTVYKLTPPAKTGGTWTETVLYRFKSGSDGANPAAPLVLDPSSGILYGTTEFGGGTGCGGTGCGTVFQITTEGQAYSVIHSFAGGGDGANPVAGLVLNNGALYCTTEFGGGTACNGSGCGTVFRLIGSGTNWTEAILHSFGATGIDGVGPSAALVFDNVGALYGTTRQGGTTGSGTVFQLIPTANPPWTENVLYSFLGGTDGADPGADLTFDSKGALYSTTSHGGTSGNGTVFQLMPPATGLTKWTKAVLYSFKGGKDGALPSGGVVFDSTGALFGLTGQGGAAKKGSIGPGTFYVLTPPKTKKGTETTVLAKTNAGYTEVVYAFTKGGSPFGDPLLNSKSNAIYSTGSIDPLKKYVNGIVDALTYNFGLP